MTLYRSPLVAFIVASLTACGGGSGSSSNDNAPAPSPDREATVNDYSAFVRTTFFFSEIIEQFEYNTDQLEDLADSMGEESVVSMPCPLRGRYLVEKTEAAGSLAYLTVSFQGCQYALWGGGQEENGQVRLIASTSDYRQAEIEFSDYQFEILGASGRTLYGYEFNGTAEYSSASNQITADVTVTDTQTNMEFVGNQLEISMDNGRVFSGGTLTNSLLTEATITGQSETTPATNYQFANGSVVRLQSIGGQYTLDVDNDGNIDAQSLIGMPAYYYSYLEDGLSISADTGAYTGKTLTAQLTWNLDALLLAEISYEITSAPSGSNPSIDILEGGFVNIIPDVAGAYTITFRASGDGLAETTSLSFTTETSLPNWTQDAEATLSFTDTEQQINLIETSDSDYQIQLAFDTPYFSLSNDGALSFIGSQQGTFFPGATYDIAVELTNSTLSETRNINITVESTDENTHIFSSPGGINNKEFYHIDIDRDGDKEVLALGAQNNIYIYEIEEDNSLIIKHTNHFDISGVGYDILDITPRFSTEKDQYEIIVATTTAVYSLLPDGYPARLLRTYEDISNQEKLEYRHVQVKALDQDFDGEEEIAILLFEDRWTNTFVEVFDPDTMAIKLEINGLALGKEFQIANVDNDPAMELIYSYGYVYDSATGINEWTTTEFEDGFYTIDVDGSGIERIISDTIYDGPSYKDIRISSVLTKTSQDWTLTDGSNSSFGTPVRGPDGIDYILSEGQLYRFVNDTEGFEKIWNSTHFNLDSKQTAAWISDNSEQPILLTYCYYCSGKSIWITFDYTTNTKEAAYPEEAADLERFESSTITEYNGDQFILMSTEQSGSYRELRHIVIDDQFNHVDTHVIETNSTITSHGYCDGETPASWYIVNHYNNAALYSIENIITGSTNPLSLPASNSQYCKDLNSDGISEVILQTESAIIIYDPATQTQQHFSMTEHYTDYNSTRKGSMFVGDIDNDGKQEILSHDDKALVKLDLNEDLSLDTTTSYAPQNILRIYKFEILERNGNTEVLLGIEADDYYEDVVLVRLNNELQEQDRIQVDDLYTVSNLVFDINNPNEIMVLGQSDRSIDLNDYHPPAAEAYYVQSYNLINGQKQWGSPALRSMGGAGWMKLLELDNNPLLLIGGKYQQYLITPSTYQ